MNNYKRYLVTSALPYANGPLHIGHLAGAYLPADIYVRYLRLIGKDVVYVGGSDEHGAAITIKAKKEGISPREIIDKYHASFKETFKKAGISFDIYHRTSEPIHHQTSQDFFRILNEKGSFVKQTSEQYYDEEANQFLADRYIVGTCPKCGHDDAYGDQCEKCGSTLSPTELINPRSTLSGNAPILKSTTHWFLSLDKAEDWLRDYLEKGTLDGQPHHDPGEWKNHVSGQCKSWLDGGLQPRAMTRDLEWGVDVPPEIEGAAGKKLYVWLDAPIGYISATKQWAIDQGDADKWKKYWQDSESKLVHFIAKDNIVFHCLIFPAILKEHGGYVLPDNVPSNQFLNLEGQKLSTSRNWAIWVHEYLNDFEDKVVNHVDVLRYNLTRIMPELRDSEFTWKGYQETNNNELVNNLGNFVNRVLVLTQKYYEGIVPELDTSLDFIGSAAPDEAGNYEAELGKIYSKLQAYCAAIEGYDFRGGLKAVLEISSLGNQLLQFNEPWRLIKTEPEKVKQILHLSVQIVAALSVACRPFLPNTSDKLRQFLNLDLVKESGELSEILTVLERGEPLVATGHTIGKAGHLFSKIGDDFINEQLEKLQNAAPAEPTFEALKEEATFDDFTKLDLRTGTVVAAEKMKKAKKLLQLTVDLGFEQRTIVSGIAEFFSAEEVVGKQVVVLANLAPKKLRGVESQGMILMAENEKGELGFVSPQDGFGNGFTVR